MIPANELRVGNWYKWNSEGKDYYFQVEQKDFANDNYKNFEPVPITNDIAGKCGFEKDKDGCYCALNYLYWLDNGYIQFAYWYTPLVNIKCRYVHQWQTLYFSLTGEELTIKF